VTVRYLDSDLSSLLREAVGRIGYQNIRTKGTGLGGGTVLAARWKHRISTDIDLFTSESTWRKIGDSVVNRLTSQSNLSVSVFPHFVSCRLPDRRSFSFGAVRNVTLRPLSNECDGEFDIPFHTSAEILGLKIHHRVLGTLQFPVRDAYDIVMAAEKDGDSLTEALDVLDSRELATFLAIVEDESLVLDKRSPLIQPIRQFDDLTLLRDEMSRVVTDVDRLRRTRHALHFLKKGPE